MDERTLYFLVGRFNFLFSYPGLHSMLIFAVMIVCFQVTPGVIMFVQKGAKAARRVMTDFNYHEIDDVIHSRIRTAIMAVLISIKLSSLSSAK